jgi:chromosome segregation protein
VDSRRATLTQIDDLLRRREERRRDLQTQQQELNLEQQQAKLNELQGEMESNRASLQPLKEKLAQNKGDLSRLEDDLSSLQRGSHELETLYTQARIELSQSENQIEGLRERITADLGLVALSYDNDQQGQTPLPIAEVVEQLPDVHKLPGDITETIQRYRGQLTRMGGFNPDAPTEYEEIKQRHDYMVQQIDDLTQTQEKLRTVIEDLDDQTSRAFATTVKQVDAQFGGVFKRLFGGGSAQLVLTDPDDLTLSGVDIVARLPRRREQGLALLSGGERSLTATALIFALLKVSPTPFCVLDEVDAMLDEANVNRFREMLQELSEQTQFILITHNRGTVQVAETVYGVSMGSDSVSQVVSIRPDDYVNSIEETVVAG